MQATKTKARSSKTVTKRQPELIRLNVLLQKYGVASRRKADAIIEAGLVSVDGKVEKRLGVKVTADAKIHVKDKLLTRVPAQRTYLFNKPNLTITSRKDEKSRPTIFDLPALRRLPANIQSVGRLDYRSEGLLVLTNDGNLALHLSHPKYCVEKTYHVLVGSPVSEEKIKKLKSGVILEDGPAKAISAKLGQKEQYSNSEAQWIEIVVHEGRNRLIRRMMDAVGLNVLRLLRVAIGQLHLSPKLKAGEIRPLTVREKKYLDIIKNNHCG